LCTLFGKVV